MPSSGSPTLVLVPTELEERRLAELGGLGLGLVARCGFGPLAAAALTAELLARLRPRRVLLVGIAGSYRPEVFPIGTALEFARVRLDGVGAGRGAAFASPTQLGFPQATGPDGVALGEELALDAAPGAPALVTVCAASGSEAEAEERRARHRDASAEDMEGFGVALACARAGVPLAIVRGLSNAVGERDGRAWRVREALEAARLRARALLARWEEEA